MRTVELLLDEVSDARVRAAWQRLADAGLPSQARHRSPSNRPHLTLASCPELTPAIRWALQGLGAQLPLRVRCTGVVRFGQPSSVLAWAVDRDTVLQRLHRDIWETVRSDSGPGTLNPLHEPRRWRPHVTLGRTRRADAFADRSIPALLPPPPPWFDLVALRSYDTETGEPETLRPRPRP